MMPPKIVVFGNTTIPTEKINALQSRQIEVSPIPASYPTDRLEYLAPFHMILLNGSSESDDDLERIRSLRRNYSMIPVILASSDPSPSYVVQAFRYGITDCVLAPFSEEQLGSVVSNYLKHPGQPGASGNVLGIIPQVMRPQFGMENNNQDADMSARFLGTFQLYRKGERIDLPGGARQRSLLAFILFHAQNPIHRDKIIRNFWPDHDPDCARNNLNVGICNLRRHLEQYFKEELICFHNGYFSLNKELTIHRDIDQFQQSFYQGKDAERHGQEQTAAKLFQSAAQMGSEFLEEFSQEDWTIRPREEFTEKFFHSLDFLSTHQQQNQQYDNALETLRNMLYKDDCLESVHCKIMACYLALGKKEMAVRQYHECERILQEKLNMRPSAKTAEMFSSARGIPLA